MKLSHLHRHYWTERLSHREVSQKEKNKYIFMHICGIHKNGIDGLICKAEIEIDIENKCMDTKARRGLE